MKAVIVIALGICSFLRVEGKIKRLFVEDLYTNKLKSWTLPTSGSHSFCARLYR